MNLIPTLLFKQQEQLYNYRCEFARCFGSLELMFYNRGEIIEKHRLWIWKYIGLLLNIMISKFLCKYSSLTKLCVFAYVTVLFTYALLWETQTTCFVLTYLRLYVVGFTHSNTHKCLINVLFVKKKGSSLNNWGLEIYF